MIPVLSQSGGFVQEVNYGALVAVAAQLDGRIQLDYRPGQFCPPEGRLGRVWPPQLEPALERHLRLGRHCKQPLNHDSAILEMGKLATLALSSGVNDVFTAISCVDWLEDTLVALLKEGVGACSWSDQQGVLRLTQPTLSFARLARAGFNPIRQAGQDHGQVQIRLLHVIQRLLPRVQPQDREVLWKQAEAIAANAQPGVLPVYLGIRQGLKTATETDGAAPILAG